MLFPHWKFARPLTVIVHDRMEIDLPGELSLAHAVDFALAQQFLCFLEASLFIQMLPAYGDRYFIIHYII